MWPSLTFPPTNLSDQTGVLISGRSQHWTLLLGPGNKRRWPFAILLSLMLLNFLKISHYFSLLTQYSNDIFRRFLAKIFVNDAYGVNLLREPTNIFKPYFNCSPLNFLFCVSPIMNQYFIYGRNWNWNTKTFFNNNYSIIEYFSQARQQVPLHFINHQLQSIKYTTNSLVQVDANHVKELTSSFCRVVD